ncbi:hypothetical protein, partial [Vibrio parahaemolyticus]|uniref:hypothetical protein n=1 Tax=Vibrio parahaemolyticus TaxID=670 RepID=UPI001BAFE1FE
TSASTSVNLDGLNSLFLVEHLTFARFFTDIYKSVKTKLPTLKNSPKYQFLMLILQGLNFSAL